MRAMSFFTWPSRDVFSCWPVASWKRSWNSSCLASLSCWMRASSGRSRTAALFFAISSDLRLDAGAGDELGLDRELLDGALHGAPGQLLVHAGELEHDATGLDHGHPPLGVALAGTHARLGRLLRDGLVREDVDPDLAAALDVAGHGDTGGLDLAGGDPPGLEGLDAELTEGDLAPALGHAGPAPAVVLAVRDLARHQHQSSPRKCGVSACSEARVRRSISSSSARRRSSSGSASLMSAAGVSSTSVSDSPRRRPPPADTTLRGRGAPDVSPTAMAASRVALSSEVILYGR